MVLIYLSRQCPPPVIAFTAEQFASNFYVDAVFQSGRLAQPPA